MLTRAMTAVNQCINLRLRRTKTTTPVVKVPSEMKDNPVAATLCNSCCSLSLRLRLGKRWDAETCKAYTGLFGL